MNSTTTLPNIQTLGQVAICVKDLDRATAFYRDVLGLSYLFSAPPELAFFQIGEVRLMLSMGEQEGFRGTSTFYFVVPNVDQALAAVRGHCEVIDEPHVIARVNDRDIWMAFFKDSEGNSHAFMEERKVD